MPCPADHPQRRRAMDQSSDSLPADGHDNAAQEKLRMSGPGSEIYSQHDPFTKQFFAALHILLISCSRQDVLNYFAQFQPRQQNVLYKIFVLTLTQVRENIAADFRSICEETRLLEALDHVRSKEFFTATDVRQSASPNDVAREIAVKRKLEEVDAMKQTLQQVKEENDLLATQLEGLRAKVAEARDLRSVEAGIDKISSMNLMLANFLSGDSLPNRIFF